jgi:hypothetical protein
MFLKNGHSKSNQIAKNVKIIMQIDHPKSQGVTWDEFLIQVFFNELFNQLENQLKMSWFWSWLNYTWTTGQIENSS